ncbi:MAG TPA: hypothetical protein VKG43_09780 [Acidimicrobiales bacterium]|nr:hypothetical protein [Acidimicrobiales bacterium]
MIGIDWTVTASLATAAGTLVLAVATFGSVRSANRSAQASELALQEGLRPVLTESRPDDRDQKISFADDRWVRVPGGRAGIEIGPEAIYLVLSVRNIGQGIGVLQAWTCQPDVNLATVDNHPPVEEFRRQTRDLYIPPGDIGLWQGALRDRSQQLFTEMGAVIGRRQPFTLFLLYSDMAGGQRAVSRFHVVPAGDDAWLGSVVRHWNLDRAGPR